MTDADLSERVWDLTRRVADLVADLPPDADTFPAMYIRNRLRDTREELGRLIDDRYRAMATTAGLNTDDREAVHVYYARLAKSDPRAHLLGSLRHLRATLGERERWALFVFAIGGEYNARRGGEGLREAFDEASDLAERLGIERPEYPEDEPTYNRARNHWLRLRQFIDRIAPAPLTPSAGGADPPPYSPTAQPPADPLNGLCELAHRLLRLLTGDPAEIPPDPVPGGHPARRFNSLADSLRELDAAALAEVTRRADYATAERLVSPLTEACNAVLAGYMENAQACVRWGVCLSMTPPNPAPAEDAAREQWAVWQTAAERDARRRATAAAGVRDAAAALERFAAATAPVPEPADEVQGGSRLPREQPEGRPALFVTIGRPWNPSEDGPRPTIDQLRPHLDERQQELVDRFRRVGQHLHDLLVVAVEGCPPPAGWRATDDADVRGCMLALAVCRDLVGRAERYSADAVHSLRIEAGGWICSRLPGEFLDTDPRFDILRHANTLRFRIAEYVDWLTVAARVRGILAAGQLLGDSAERQLGYAVAPTPPPADTGTPAGRGKRPGKKPLEETNPAVLNVYQQLHTADRTFEPEGGSRKGRRERLLLELRTAPEHRQVREAVGDAGLILTPELIQRAVKCIEKRNRS